MSQGDSLCIRGTILKNSTKFRQYNLYLLQRSLRLDPAILSKFFRFLTGYFGMVRIK